MAKAIKTFILVFGTVFFLWSGTVFAAFIEVEGFVDTNSANFTDLGGNLTQVSGL